MKNILFAILLPTLLTADTASKITQWGITWTFDKAYEVGQFVNGDWWVVGPVTIISISPKSIVESNGRIRNGSMLTPKSGGGSQGYDNTMFWKYKSNQYQNGLNVALNVSASKLLVVQPNNSLVSSISKNEANTEEEQMETAAVLTVLDKAAPENSFRPPYNRGTGVNRQVHFSKANLDYSRLLNLAPAPLMPSFSSLADNFDRVWLDHLSDWGGETYGHPDANLPNYGRQISTQTGQGALALNTAATPQQKEKLLIGFVQAGLDMYGLVQAGRKWFNNGGHDSGRKILILLAGHVLNSQEILNFEKTYSSVTFAEDMQTFYVTETSAGVYNNGYGGYTSSWINDNKAFSTSQGIPEWGIRHASTPSMDNNSWGSSYRSCCTANAWAGYVLTARLLDLKKTWNHDALFDYQDRYMATEEGKLRQTDTWTELMWNRYQNYTTGISKDLSTVSDAGNAHFPNPIKSIKQFHQYLLKGLKGVTDVSIMDVSGNIILTRDDINNNSNQLDQGRYIFSVISSSKKIHGNFLLVK